MRIQHFFFFSETLIFTPYVRCLPLPRSTVRRPLPVLRAHAHSRGGAAVKCAPGKGRFSAKRLKIRPNGRNFRPKSRNSSKSMGYEKLEPLSTADHHSTFGGAQNAVFRALDWLFAAFHLQIRPNGQSLCPTATTIILLFIHSLACALKDA